MKNVLAVLFLLGVFIGLNTPVSSQILDSPRDGIFDKIHVYEKKPIPYTHIREADVAWQKRVWRTIDFRQKINHPFYFPETPTKEWKNLITVLVDAIREGSITAYDPQDDQFLVPMTYQELENKIVTTQLIPQTDPDDPNIIIGYQEIKDDFRTSRVQRLRLKEDWFFDKQRSVLDVRIIGICPVMNYIDESGNFTGQTEPMFWIYFPEARPILAQAIVFNRSNSAEMRTYDEIFWQRMFGSYIHKEENVYDRNISDYASGMDALLEAERIKSELAEFEHSLWEF